MMPIGAKMYEQTAEPEADAAAASDDDSAGKDKSKDGPVEGEVVDDDKK